MSQDRVLYATHEGIHVLRFVGNIRAWLAPSLDRFVTRLFETSSLSGLLMDLTETESIDSTNLGLLARIAIRIRERDQPRVTMLSERDAVLAGAGRPVDVLRAGDIDPGAMPRPVPNLTDEEGVGVD